MTIHNTTLFIILVILLLCPGNDLRDFMLSAHAHGWTTSGEYVFITIEIFKSIAWGDTDWNQGEDKL